MSNEICSWQNQSWETTIPKLGTQKFVPQLAQELGILRSNVVSSSKATESEAKTFGDLLFHGQKPAEF